MSKKFKRFLSLALVVNFLLSEILIPINTVYALANESKTSITTSENTMEASQVKIKVSDDRDQDLKGIEFGLYKKGESEALTTSPTDENGEAIICGSCLFLAPAGDYEIRLENSENYKIDPDKSTYASKSVFNVRININENNMNFIESLEGTSNKNMEIKLTKKSELSFINLNVKDANTNPLEGVELEVLDSSETPIEDIKLVSDKDGLIKGDISSLPNGKYSLALKGSKYELMAGLNPDNFKVRDGEIDTIEDVSFSKPITLIVEKNQDLSEPEEPVIPVEKTDLSYINLEVHGRNNKPLEGFEFVLNDENDKEVKGLTFKSDNKGLIKADISILKNGSYKIVAKNNDPAILAGINPNNFKVTNGQIDELENSRFKDQVKIIIDADGKDAVEEEPSNKDPLSFLNLQVKSNKKPVKGVAFELIDQDNNPLKSPSLVSDDKGLIKADLSGLKDGSYSLKLKGDSYKLLGGLNQDSFEVLNGKIDIVSSSYFTKQVNIFVMENEDLSQPEKPEEKNDPSFLNLQVINVGEASTRPIEFELVDKNNNPVKTIKLLADKKGSIKADISSLADGKYDLQLKGHDYIVQAGLNYSEINIKSGKITTSTFNKLVKVYIEANKKNEGNESKSILKIRTLDTNNNPLEGLEFEMLDLTMDNSKLYDLDLKSNSRGEIINDLKNLYDGKYELLMTNSKDYKLASKDSSYIIEMEDHKIKSIDGQAYSGQLDIYFEAKDSSSVGQAKILELTPSINARLSRFATPMEVKVIGEGLTNDNWSYETETYIKNKDIIVKDQKLAIEKVANDTLKLQVPENKNEKHIQYKIKVGILKDGKLTNTKTLVINQNGRIEMIDITPNFAILTNPRQIVIDFPKDISMYADDMDELKSYIYISEMNKEDRIKLSKDDEVKIHGNQLIINFSKDIKLSALNHINIDEGALVTSDNELLRDLKWTVSYDTEITGITLDTEIFDYKAGRVTSKVLGHNLSKIKAEDLVVKVHKAGQLKPTDIKAEINIGDDITISYDLPENTGKYSESYYISMDLNKAPVYIDKSIVTVMPKGMAKTETTISAISLGGNNVIQANENSTEVTIAVKPTSGELKVIVSIYGANLDNVKTEVRAIDEYGVIWPVYHCPV